MKTSVPSAIALLLLLPSLSASGDEVVYWIEPSQLPFVPTPSVVLAHAPVPTEEKCVGSTLISPGPMPWYVSYVRVETLVERCLLSMAEVEWQINGTTYRGMFDASTNAVLQIQKVAEDPTLVAGATYEGDPAGTLTGALRGERGEYWPDVTRKTGEDDDRYIREGTMWYGKTSHVWLHFWAKSGSGNENVKVNYNWRYASMTRRETEMANIHCGADGVWRNHQCHVSTFEALGKGPPGSGAHGFGGFSSVVWPHDEHEWHTEVWPRSDQTPEGRCYSRGELPWFYGSNCEVGPGNV